MAENRSFGLQHADLLAAPDTPYSVSDILILAQQTGNHRVYGFICVRHCGWPVVAPFARNISLCLSPLMSAGFSWFGLGLVGVATMLESYLPLCVHVWGSECLNINFIGIVFLVFFVNAYS